MANYEQVPLDPAWDSDPVPSGVDDDVYVLKYAVIRLTEVVEWMAVRWQKKGDSLDMQREVYGPLQIIRNALDDE